MTMGFFLLSRFICLQISSEAGTSPPGESIRTITPLMLESAPDLPEHAVEAVGREAVLIGTGIVLVAAHDVAFADHQGDLALPLAPGVFRRNLRVLGESRP